MSIGRLAIWASAAHERVKELVVSLETDAAYLQAMSERLDDAAEDDARHLARMATRLAQTARKVAEWTEALDNRMRSAGQLLALFHKLNKEDDEG